MYIKEYQIGSKIYEDVIGSLYLANTADLSKTVYFKILHEKYSNQDDLVNAFHKCAEIYCNFENENQVQALEHDREEGKHYIILEYLNLTPLEKILQRKNVFSIIDAVTTIENIAHIIRTYHLEEIVQGYLTPQNIFIDAELEQIKISDFGFQEFVSLVVAKKQGNLFNTLPYYAPELIAGKPQADHRSDIYALGVLFYRILVGETPWIVRDLNEHVKHPPAASIIPPSLQRLAIPDFLDNVIFESIEPEMEKRYQNVSQFIDKISEAKASVLTNITPITSQILQAEQKSPSDVTPQPTFSNKQPSNEGVKHNGRHDDERDNNHHSSVNQDNLKEHPISHQSGFPPGEVSSIPQDVTENMLSKENEFYETFFPQTEDFEELPLTQQSNLRQSSNIQDEETTEFPYPEKYELKEKEIMAVTLKNEDQNSSKPISQQEVNQDEPEDRTSFVQTASNEQIFANSEIPLSLEDLYKTQESQQQINDNEESSLQNQAEKQPETSPDLELEAPLLDPKEEFENYLEDDMMVNNNFHVENEFTEETATQTEEFATTQTLNIYKGLFQARSLRSKLNLLLLSIIPLLLIFTLVSLAFDIDWSARFPNLKSSILNKMQVFKKSSREQKYSTNTSKKESNRDKTNATGSINGDKKNTQTQELSHSTRNTQIDKQSNFNESSLQHNKMNELLHPPDNLSSRKNSIQESEATKLQPENKHQITSILSNADFVKSAAQVKPEPVQPTSGILKLFVKSGQVPPNAAVYLNGKFIGNTNSDGLITIANLKPQQLYLVKVQQSGFEMWAKEVSLNRPGTEIMDVELRDLPMATLSQSENNLNKGTVTVLLSNPQNINYAFVYINGKLWQDDENIAPAKLKLPEGTYLIEVKKEGFRSEPPSYTLELSKGDNKKIYFYLLPK